MMKTKKIISVLMLVLIITSNIFNNDVLALSTSGDVYISTIETISGSINDYLGNISEYSDTITLTSDHDFKVGQGIIVKGAGENNADLITQVIEVKDKLLKLENKAAKAVTNAKVFHDDTFAVNQLIEKGYKNYYFDSSYLNVRYLKLLSERNYIGNSTHIVTELEENNSNGTDGVIVGEDLKNILIQGFVIDDNHSVKNNNGIVLKGELTSVNINDNTISSKVNGIMLIPNNNNYLNGYNLNFTNNTIKSNSDVGIAVYSGMNNNYGFIKKMTIQTNKLSNNEDVAISYGGRSQNVIISDNKITGSNDGIVSVDTNLEATDNITYDYAIIETNKMSDIAHSHMVIDGRNIHIRYNSLLGGSEPILLGQGMAEAINIHDNTFSELSVTNDQVIKKINVARTYEWNNTYFAADSVETTTEQIKKAVDTEEIEEVTIETPIVVETPTVEVKLEIPSTVSEVELNTDASQIYLSQYANVSGSIQEYKGTINAGSNILILSTGSHDFKVGQGLAIEGASNISSFDYWLTTKITKIEGNQLYLDAVAKNYVSYKRVIHDDTRAINSIISEPYKTYHFDLKQMNVKGLELVSNTNYVGENITLTIPASYESVNWVQGMIIATDVHNVEFSGFNVNGGKYNGIQGDDQLGIALMYMFDSSNFNIHNNHFYNNNYVALDFQGNISNITVDSNNIEDTDVGVLVMPKWRGSLNLNNIVISNNVIDGGTSEGISIESGMYDNTGVATQIEIINNTIKNKEATGIQYGSRSSNVLIKNNYIFNSNVGISTRDENLEPTYNMISKEVVLESNIITNVKYNHMILDGSNITIKYNTLNNGNTAIILGRGVATNIEIYENTFNKQTVPESRIIYFKNVDNKSLWNNKYY